MDIMTIMVVAVGGSECEFAARQTHLKIELDFNKKYINNYIYISLFKHPLFHHPFSRIFHSDSPHRKIDSSEFEFYRMNLTVGKSFSNPNKVQRDRTSCADHAWVKP